jgi:CubicO group peptidase (beta-lactamase class C family)
MSTIRGRTWLLLFVCLSAASLARCTRASGPTDVAQLPADGESYWPDAAWRTARPEQVGLDDGILRGLVSRLQSSSVPGLHSLVVVRNGYLVVEEYFNGSRQGDVHTMQSVSKSVTSLLVGIAADQGKLHLDDTLLSLFPAYTDLQAVDERKQAITVRDLLTMRSGIDFYESPYPGSPLQVLNDSRGDWIRLVLDRPMNAAPNVLWQYNSGGVIVLAGVLRNTTGENPIAFAHRNLFEPLGISGERWATSPYDGLPHTGGGLALRAIDLARIGYLVLRHGRWRDRQIVSEGWLAQSTTPYTTRPRAFGSHVTDYGYLWWLLPLDGSGNTSARDGVVYTAAGALSQWLFVVPKHDIVVAVTGGTDQSFLAPVDFLYSDILRAVR